MRSLIQAAECLSDQRGNALILAMLILLTLTSVGVVSVQRTSSDLMVAGNIARVTQAQVVGEQGMMHGLGRVGADPNHYMKVIETQRTGGSTGLGIDESPRLGIAVARGSTTQSSTDLHIPWVEPDTSSDEVKSLAFIRQMVAYDVESVWINEGKGMPGYDVATDICHEVFDYSAMGGIPTALGETVQATMNQKDTVVVENRARAISGPVLCYQK